MNNLFDLIYSTVNLQREKQETRNAFNLHEGFLVKSVFDVLLS